MAKRTKAPVCKKGTPCGFACLGLKKDGKPKACKQKANKELDAKLTQAINGILANGGGKVPDSLKKKVLDNPDKYVAKQEQVSILAKYAEMEWPDANKGEDYVAYANGLDATIWDAETQRFTGNETSILMAQYFRNNPAESVLAYYLDKPKYDAIEEKLGKARTNADAKAYELRESIAYELDWGSGYDDSDFNALDKAEGIALGRGKSSGKYAGEPGKKLLEQQAEEWAKQQGFDTTQGVNGFTAEQAKAHDLSHPAMKALTGLTTESIKQHFGDNSLVHEEAIVNLLEHLVAGDTYGGSLQNAVRVAKVLARSEGDETNRIIRTNSYGSVLYNLMLDMLSHPDYADIARHVRESLKVSETVLATGNSTQNVRTGA